MRVYIRILAGQAYFLPKRLEVGTVPSDALFGIRDWSRRQGLGIGIIPGFANRT